MHIGPTTRVVHTKGAGSKAFRHLAALVCCLLLFALVSLSIANTVAFAEGETAPAAQEATNTADAAQTDAKQIAYKARPSTSGKLHVTGTQLCDENDRPVLLRGVSTHGLTWYPQFVDDKLFAQVSKDWDCNIVRLAMYTENYCDGEREKSLEILHKGIKYAIENDMYVMVDWHILHDNDPNINIDQALKFFELISTEYADVPNVIFEICNEPNGETTWDDVYRYANAVIPVIRQNSPSSLIIVGTPVFDRELMMAARRPLEFDNLMYTLHFYVATHGEDLRNELVSALDAGLPIFATECGLSEASGDGTVDFESAVQWFSLMNKYNISYTIWSLSDKPETASLIRTEANTRNGFKTEDLTPVGLWARDLILGKDPQTIPIPDVNNDDMLTDTTPDWLRTLNARDFESAHSWGESALIALAAVLIGFICWTLYQRFVRRKHHTYDDVTDEDGHPAGVSLKDRKHVAAVWLVILTSTFFTLVYLIWRVRFSIPFEYGALAVAGNLILLFIEVLGTFESSIHHQSMICMRSHPLPKIADEDYPEVDIFISTYNEPVDLLRRTINGCNHLSYPDKSKVHVWLCDDNRRPQMRELAESMGVGYFDRPDNKGAKAGNLNHAMSLTSAPYIVTLDADMIVRSEFLLKTIPYFVNAERHNADLEDDDKIRLGVVQTPQAFYDPDVFQHCLYAENHVTNEQDFFYRTIEVAKTSTNSVIYGGSNTVLSRAALEEIGGFYTESITEDFATGMLIESSGYVSLGLDEPLASGRCPHTFEEHIQQRTRWGRGVIVTARKLHLMTRPGLTLSQRLSYWSSVVYWYSPIKNFIYIMSPLLYAVFCLPIFVCSWLDLIIFWLPMFIMQSICLRVVSCGSTISRWSGIHETTVMPFLLIPIVKELLGISLSVFEVTDKSGKEKHRDVNWRLMTPFLILLALSAAGIIRVVTLFFQINNVSAAGLGVLLFWLIRNAYYLLMGTFLIDGRDSDGEPVKVIGADPVIVTAESQDEDGETKVYEGIATKLTEHSMRVFLDFSEDLKLGERVSIQIEHNDDQAELSGIVTGVTSSRSGAASVHSLEVIDFGDSSLDYLQILYNRAPSLPQTVRADLGIFGTLWRNIAYRIADTVQ